MNATLQDPLIPAGAQPADQLTEQFRDVQPSDPNAPRTVFPSALRLTREQEDALCAHARRRYEELDLELGRSETELNGAGIPKFFDSSIGQGSKRILGQRKFFEKRALYQLMIQNDYSWRPILMPKSIFAKSNLVVPVCRRIWKQMTARAHNYFFGTNPWLAVQGIGVEDEATAKGIQALTETKLRENQNEAAFRRCLPVAFGMGECVLKTVHVRDVNYYETLENVAVEFEGGEILSGADGEPIKETDTWLPLPTGGFVLERDQQTKHLDPTAILFEQRLLQKEHVNYTGPSVRPVYYRDFMAPLNAPNLQDADCVVHIMSMSVNALAAQYLQNPGEDLDRLAAAIQAINAMRANDGSFKAGADTRAEYGEYTQPINDSESNMLAAEFYIRFDANGDGYQEDIMLAMDITTGYPISYDYVANLPLTKDGKRPFTPIVPNPLDGRWFGIGTFEMFERHQEVIDLMINRRSVSQGEAGRVVGWRPENTVEGQLDPNLKLNWGGTYKLAPGKKWEDTLFVTYLSDNKFEYVTQEMESQLQFALNESGVQHANDAAVSGMDTTKLATGIRNIEKSGQEMFGVYISELEGGLTDAASMFVKVLYANMDDEETFLFFNGKVPMELTLAARNVKTLRFNVTTLLSRYKDEQLLTSNSQASMVIKEYYAMPPNLQIILQSFYENILTALQVKNPAQYLVPQPVALPPSGTGTPQGPAKESNLAVPNL